MLGRGFKAPVCLEEACPLTSTTSSMSFLDLPYSAREKVYLHLGIVLCCTISLNKVPPKEVAGRKVRVQHNDNVFTDRSMIRFGDEVVGPCLSHGIDLFSACLHQNRHHLPRKLFLISRQVSLETRKLYYSGNKFVVHRCGNNGLFALSRLHPAHLGWIRSLRIEINTAVSTHSFANKHLEKERREFCTCHCNQDVLPANNDYPHCVCAKADEPLDIATSRAKRAFKEFEETVLSIHETILPNRLQLGIICDTANQATAEAFATIIQNLPQLQECSIRFSSSIQDAERNIAIATVRKVTAKQDLQLDLRRLPSEIRWKIIQHMGLIAPFDIQWKGTGTRPGYSLHQEHLRSDHVCMAVKGWAHSRSSWATSCQCWSYPIELFLLNKEYNAFATRIFFTMNHFIILPNRGYNLPGPDRWWFYTHQKSPSYSSFFRNISKVGIGYLRSLQFVIPLHGEMVSADDDLVVGTKSATFGTVPNYWYHSLVELAQHSMLRKLTLILDFSTLDHRPLRPNPAMDGIQSWDNKLNLYTKSVEREFRLNPALKEFFVYTPDNIKLLGLDSKYENALMGPLYCQSVDYMERKYSHPNRSQYWYNYAVGKELKEDLVMDAYSYYDPLLDAAS